MSLEATAEPRSSRRTWLPVLVLTLIIAVPAFLVNPIVWAPAPDGPVPTAAQIPYLIAMDAMQAIFLGLGVSFLLFALPIMRNISPRLEDEGVGYVPLHRLVDDLLVAAHRHARPQFTRQSARANLH